MAGGIVAAGALPAAVGVGVYYYYKGRPIPRTPLVRAEFEELDALRNSIGLDALSYFNVGFVGMSKVGKSSLLNALLNLRNNQPGAARVDVQQATTTIRAYNHSRFPGHIKLWDIPGCGTPEFPIRSYVHDCKLRAFPCLVVCYKDTIPEWMLDGLTVCSKYGIRAIVVRTQADKDVDNLVDDRGLSETEAINVLRGKVQDEVNALGNVPVFIVSARDMHRDVPLRFDEERLQAFLLHCAAGSRGFNGAS